MCHFYSRYSHLVDMVITGAHTVTYVTLKKYGLCTYYIFVDGIFLHTEMEIKLMTLSIVTSLIPGSYRETIKNLLRKINIKPITCNFKNMVNLKTLTDLCNCNEKIKLVITENKS